MKPRALGIATVFLFLAHALFYFYALGYDAVDDAYISFRYAQNAVWGHGLVFNPGERVEGFTNFLWTALLTPIVGASFDVGRVSILLGVCCALGTLWLTVRLGRALSLPAPASAFAALLLAADGSFAIWSVGGLETALFTFLITGGAWFYIQEQAHERLIPRSAIFFALAAMTRPEAVAVFAITSFHQAAWRVFTQRRWVQRRWVQRIDLARGLTFATLFVPYWIARWRYYHSFFPNSFYAKVAPGGPLAQLERGWHYVTQFVNVHLGWWILLPAALALLLALARVRTGDDTRPAPGKRLALFGFSYIVLVVSGYVGYIIYVGGDWSIGRFFVPLLPLSYIVIAAGLFDLFRFFTRRLVRARQVAFYLGSASAALFIVGLAYASSWNGEYGIYVRGFDAGRATAARETMGTWLKNNVPRGTLIAVDAAGQVPFFSELPSIDMFGINDLHIGRLPVATLGAGTPGHEKFDLAYIIERAPRFVIIYGNLFDSVSEYRRAPVRWTQDAELENFLTIYERR